MRKRYNRLMAKLAGTEADPRLYDAEQDIAKEVDAARAQVEASAGVTSKAAAEIRATAIASAVGTGKRAFVSGSVKTFKKLVKAGKPTICYGGTDMPFLGGQSPSGVETRRIGDIWAVFVGGIMVIDPEAENGPIIIEWAEHNPDICRDAMDPMTDVWVALKESQANTSLKEPTLSPEMDVDKVLAGDFSGFGNAGSVGARARQILATR